MSTDAPPPLEPLAEDWERALCVVAHPDDMEFGAAAAVARWTGQGKQVAYCMVTSGEAGIDGLHPDEAGPLREDEQLEACRAVGVDACDFLRLRDGVLEYGVALRAAIAREVRLHRPEIVITGNFRDTFGGRNLNQADHIAVGRAVLDAVRDAGNRWIFPDQLVDDLEPWGGVREVLGGRLPGARTASTPPTPSTRASPRWRPTAPTSTASAGSTSTRGSSSRAWVARPVSGWVSGWRRRSRSTRWAGATDGRASGRARCSTAASNTGPDREGGRPRRSARSTRTWFRGTGPCRRVCRHWPAGSPAKSTFPRSTGETDPGPPPK